MPAMERRSVADRSWNIITVGDPPGQGLLDRVLGPYASLGLRFREGRHLRQIGQVTNSVALSSGVSSIG